MGGRGAFLCVSGCRRPLEPMDLRGVGSGRYGVSLELSYHRLAEPGGFAMTAPEQTRGRQNDCYARGYPRPASRHDCQDVRDHGWRPPGRMYVYTRSSSTSLRACTNPLRSNLPNVVFPSIDMSTGSARSTMPMCTASSWST